MDCIKSYQKCTIHAPFWALSGRQTGGHADSIFILKNLCWIRVTFYFGYLLLASLLLLSVQVSCDGSDRTYDKGEFELINVPILKITYDS